MDWVAWIFPAIVGTFVMFSAYLLAGLIIKDDIFKFLLAFTLSISQGILNYTTWQISARGFFVLLLPFFLYLLLKSRSFPVRLGILTFHSSKGLGLNHEKNSCWFIGIDASTL